MTSIEKYLNTLVDVVTYNTNTRTSTGAKIKIESVVQSDIYVRITQNKGNQFVAGSGIYATSTHLIFSLSSATVENGYYIRTKSNVYYKIDFVEKNPGGVTTNHYQMYCSRVEGMSDV